MGIAFGAYRKSTISVFALFANNGACIPNSALVKDISKELLALLEGHGQLDYYCGAEHGFISVQPGRCKLNKQDGLTYVANMCASLFMIGDDWRDIAEHSSVKTALVGNADSALKDKVTYVSSKPYTEGVVDILNKIREGKL